MQALLFLPPLNMNRPSPRIYMTEPSYGAPTIITITLRPSFRLPAKLLVACPGRPKASAQADSLC